MRVLLWVSTSAATTIVRRAGWRLRDSLGVARLRFDGHPDCPNEPQQLTRNRCHDLRLILSPREESLEPSMQAMLRLPRDLEDARTEANVPLPELVAHGRPPAIGPRGFDDDPAQMRIAGFGDAPGAAALARGVLTRDQAAVAHQLWRALESREVADFGHDGHGGGFRPAPQRLPGARHPLPSGRGGARAAPAAPGPPPAAR